MILYLEQSVNILGKLNNKRKLSEEFHFAEKSTKIANN